jgi:hypothetical protein
MIRKLRPASFSAISAATRWRQCNKAVITTTMIPPYSIAEKDAGRSLRIIYRTAVERFLLTVVMFAVGIGVLKLEPLVLIGGFVLVLSAQMLDWFIESRMMRNHGKRRDPYLW